MYVKAFIVNVNKCLKPFFLEQHINIVNRVTLQSFGLSVISVCLHEHVHVIMTNNVAHIQIIDSEWSLNDIVFRMLHG